MKLYSYVVARDYGFAPNPFFGVCSLATCKPKIRAKAHIGDWVVGIGSAQNRLRGRLVFVMRVDETLTFDQYWTDPRFLSKRPNLCGSVMQAFGDNVYHQDHRSRQWIQASSHHSFPDGTANPLNIAHDTQAPRVLLGQRFVYWGCEGPEVPARFRTTIGRGGRPDRCNFPSMEIQAFLRWIDSLGQQGFVGMPLEFKKLYSGKRRPPR